MSSISEVEIRIVSERGEKTPGLLVLTQWSSGERCRRALRCVAICWGSAIPLVFVPGLHFILPPLLMVGGVIGGLLKWREHALILPQMLKCPQCGVSSELISTPPEWPLFHRCDHCNVLLRLEKITD